jgi:hypothetical protein
VLDEKKRAPLPGRAADFDDASAAYYLVMRDAMAVLEQPIAAMDMDARILVTF